MVNIENDDLAPSIASARVDIVIHTAGKVDLTSDSGITHNAHVVGTANVLRASLARNCNVRAFVHTSSIAAVTSPYVTHSQVDLPSNYFPTKDISFCSYAKTKLISERAALSFHSPSFRVCALRMPMIYGIEDPMIVVPLLSGNLTHVPNTTGIVTEFVYVENAAYAHVKAAEQLFRGKLDVGGRAYNVTNGGTPRPSLETWNTLVKMANQTFPNKFKLKPLKTLPIYVVRLLARLSSLTFWLFCGHVPFREHSFWNLTPDSLALACTPVTQNIDETISLLDYRPLYSTIESFEHMLCELNKEI